MLKKKLKPNQILLKTIIINLSMLKGNKFCSEKHFFKVFNLLQQLSKKNSKKIFQFSVINILPFIGVKIKKKKTRVFYEIPFLLKPTLRIFYAIKTIIENTKKKKKSFSIEFKEELIKILNRNSDVLKQKEEIHKYSFSKKIFSHFRWF